MRSLNMIMNSVGDNTPPCITPAPIFVSQLFTQNFVYLQNHLIVFIKSSSMPIFCIFLNSNLWSTVSNADFRSMYRLHSFLFPLFSIFSFRISVILSRFSSHPSPLLNPAWLLFSMNYPFTFSCCFNLLFSMVSKILYIGGVFVIGLAL